jgi:hypothetical protein
VKDYSHLLNFQGEEIVFKFFGKIGRFGLSWRNGQWIITNKRLIFITKEYYPMENRSFHAYLGRPFILIIPLKEITTVKKGDKKIVVIYHGKNRWNGSLAKLGIGFFHKDYKNYKISGRDGLINNIYNFLIRGGKKQQPKMLYCPECGNKIDKNDYYCTNCGKYLRN